MVHIYLRVAVAPFLMEEAVCGEGGGDSIENTPLPVKKHERWTINYFKRAPVRD